MLRARKRLALVARCVVAAGCAGQPHGVPTRVIIPRGASFAQATDSLAGAGLVGSPKLFRLYGRVTGGGRNIKPRTYLFKHGNPWGDIISAMKGGGGGAQTGEGPPGENGGHAAPPPAPPAHSRTGRAT